ncbi:MAG TPA: hypothetical protein VHY08_27850 [Bacillota bacterium]|nr:hypothetical protein [Bacillota bacterium]
MDMIQSNILLRDKESEEYEQEIRNLKAQLIEIVKSSHVEAESQKKLENQIDVKIAEQLGKVIRYQTDTQKYFERLNPLKKCKKCGGQFIPILGFSTPDLCERCYLNRYFGS